MNETSSTVFTARLMRKNTRRITAVAAVITASVLTASCASTPTASSSAAPGSTSAVAGSASVKGKTFVLVPGLTTDPGYTTMMCGALAEANSLGVKLLYQGTTTWSPTLQIPLVQSLLAQDPAALILTPTDGSALAPVVKQYAAKNIPVVALDTTLTDPSPLTSQITSSGIQGGAAAADAIGAKVGNAGKVSVISGNAGASTDQARVKGFQDEMKAKYPGISVLPVEYSQDSISVASTKARAQMLSNVDLKGIFGVDGNSATGAANAVNAVGQKGKIVVAGYDAEPAAVKLLQDGSLGVLVIQDFATEGKLGVQYAYAALTGDKSAIKPSVALDNIIATSANVSDPSITKYFYRGSC